MINMANSFTEPSREQGHESASCVDNIPDGRLCSRLLCLLGYYQTYLLRYIMQFADIMILNILFCPKWGVGREPTNKWLEVKGNYG